MFAWTRFAPQLWPQPTQIVQRNVFHNSDVIYYDAAEYLPPLNTGGTQSPSPKKGEPEHATQPIISVPPEADNRAQTIVTPPNVKLDHDVPLPNIVAWARPQPTIPPVAVADSPSNLKLPVLPTSVIAPGSGCKQYDEAKFGFAAGGSRAGAGNEWNDFEAGRFGPTAFDCRAAARG